MMNVNQTIILIPLWNSTGFKLLEGNEGGVGKEKEKSLLLLD